VLCKECRHTRFRKDSFMDLSLVIKPFGSQEINGSVEAAIDFFVRPETMGEGNQVRGWAEEVWEECFP
jgi:ubiquitin carboxyl-terminal hydrolase 47